jgi:hypothetical protein
VTNDLTKAGAIDLAEVRKLLTGQDVASQRIAAEVDRRADDIVRALFEIGLGEDMDTGARLRALDMLVKVSQREEQMRLDTARADAETRNAELREKAAKTLERLVAQDKLPEALARELRGA